jgi:hypothetical protein
MDTPRDGDQHSANLRRAKASTYCGIAAILGPIFLSALVWGWAKGYSGHVSESWGLEFGVAAIGILVFMALGVTIGISAFLLGHKGIKDKKDNEVFQWSAAGRVLGIVSVFGCIGFVVILFIPNADSIHYPEAVPNYTFVRQVKEQGSVDLRPAIDESLALCNEMHAHAEETLVGKGLPGIEAYQKKYVEDYRPRLIGLIDRISKSAKALGADPHGEIDPGSMQAVTQSLDAVQSVISRSYVISPDNPGWAQQGQYYPDYIDTIKGAISSLQGAQMLLGQSH